MGCPRKEIARICRKHLFQEKILLVNSFSQGDIFLKSIAEEGCDLFNLRAATLLALAEKIAAPVLYRENLQVINTSAAEHLVFNILEALLKKEELSYYKRSKVSGSLAGSIRRTLGELKMAAVNLTEKDAAKFVTAEKGKDLKKIYDSYQQQLQEKGCLDEGGLLARALQILENRKAFRPDNTSLPLYLMLESTAEALTFLEKKLAAALGGSSLQVIADASPAGNKGAASFNMFSSYGENAEVKEVLRCLKKGNVPLDKAAVFYTASSPYAELFGNLCQQHGLPLSLGEGWKISSTGPGKFLFALLEWIRNDFRVTDFNRMLSDRILNPGEGMPPFPEIKEILRAAAVGWTRQRYSLRLEKKRKTLEQKIKREKKTARAGSREVLEKELEDVCRVQAFFKGLFACLPSSLEENVSLAALARGLKILVENYAFSTSRMDREAVSKIGEELELFSLYAESVLSREDSLNRIKEGIGGLRVNREGPRPGCLHVDHYQNGAWLSRQHIFVVGLDAGRFPGSGKEEPALLDRERSKLAEHLFLRKDIPRENRRKMEKLFSDFRGESTLSYSSFDTGRQREQFPSSFFLQAYRGGSGETQGDYTGLQDYLGCSRGFVPPGEEDVLDEADFWLAALAFPSCSLQMETVQDCYPHLQRGRQALTGRAAFCFTVYDGKIQVKREKIDPRENRKTAVSPTRLEFLARCPFAYFLRHVLKIEAPEDLEYDPTRWLDPLSRGILLHRIYERFYRRLLADGSAPRQDKHETFLMEMAQELLEGQKGELPPPSELIYRYECREILNSLRVFLRSEEKQAKKSRPLYLELAFGLRYARKRWVSLTLPSGKEVYLAGKIDRVDIDEEGNFLAYDYKTGSASGFSERDHFRGGRQLQHALYALVLEKILQEDYPRQQVRVAGGGYIFPTSRGEGFRLLKRQRDRQELLSLLEDLFELLADGSFVMTDEEEDCKYCDYPLVCERNLYKEAVAAIQEHEPQLTPFRRVRKYA